ncbi:MAG TPA: serine/threonine protein phosphatase [Clostridiales bacterium]|nr:serine/threonine protein phosphatase [Clostridiales bacterium]
MALFAISDLHLSLSSDKPMDVFTGWQNYVERIRANWVKVVKPDDTVILPGDLSWGLKLEEAKADFEFINNLPGKKYIIKGNHDYWWTTMRKMKNFFEKNGFDTLDFIHNSAVTVGSVCACGTRGWFFDDTESSQKLILREAGRLETSLKIAADTGLEPIVFLHYPPVYGGQVCHEIFDVIKKYGVNRVYYGHIHGENAAKLTVGSYEGVKLRLVSCDQVGFTPVLVER